MSEHDGRLFWERRPDETAHAFAAFAIYRDLGLTRSLRRAAKLFYADGSQETPAGPPSAGTDTQTTRLKRWSRAHLWKDRAEAFDAEESRRRSLQTQQQRIEMLESHLLIAKLGLKVSAKTLHDCARGEAYFPASQLPALVNSITNLHRLTLGEATARTEQVNKPAERQPDFSALTDEEIAWLDEIGRKLGTIDDT